MGTEGASIAVPAQEETVLAEEHGAVRVATLNRPKALNAINADLLSAISGLYEKWEKDDNVQLIILKAAGRLFSAGGDLKYFYFLNAKNPAWTGLVYQMYWFDYHVATYKKPIVSLMHATSVGGGATLGFHGRYQVVTEKTAFTMPEAAIGLHTDCGGSYLLSHLAGHLGEYLGLTGARLDGAELVTCGLASHFVPAERLADLETSLLSLASPSDESIKAILDEYGVSPKLGERSILHRQADIDKWFSKNSVEEILETLVEVFNETQDAWVKTMITSMQRASPTGLKVTFRSIREARSQDLDECLKREFRLTLNIMFGLIPTDVFEGIRATVIEKDNKPKWNPSSLAEVTAKSLDSAFQPFPPDQELQVPSHGKLPRWQGYYNGFIFAAGGDTPTSSL